MIRRVKAAKSNSKSQRGAFSLTERGYDYLEEVRERLCRGERLYNVSGKTAAACRRLATLGFDVIIDKDEQGSFLALSREQLERIQHARHIMGGKAEK